MSEWCRLFAQFEMFVSFLLAERVGFLAYLSGADQPPTTSLTLVATAAAAGVWVDPLARRREIPIFRVHYQ